MPAGIQNHSPNSEAFPNSIPNVIAKVGLLCLHNMCVFN